jgi:probable HAF family extracellular repeat protein
MKRTNLISFCLSVLVLVMPAGAQHYKPIDLGTLPGGNLSNAYGVNDQGRVVGLSKTTGNFNHGFLWTKKAGMKDLGTLGGNFSSAQAINDATEIVGQADTSAPAGEAFRWTNGTMQDLGNLGKSPSQANAINFDALTKSFTQIAGWSLTSDGSAYHAVIWDASNNILDLGTLGGSASFAFGNNCNGQVVGTSATTSGANDAFVWDSVHGMQDLGTLGGTMSQANAINCFGVIVGYSTLTGDVQTDPFVYANGSMKDLGTLGGSSAQANAINDAGQVVGFSRTAADADSHAFLWTPTGGMQDLNQLIPAHSGWDLLGANGISNNGKIVGAGTINGAQHAFLLVPVK